MRIRVTALALLVSLLPAAPLAASGKKEVKAFVSFHMETEPTDNPKMTFEQLTVGKTRTFRRVPEVSTKDIAAFVPFPSGDGGDYGVLFILKDNAAKRLNAVTNMNQGRYMVSQLNGRIVDGVLISKPVEDGQMVIWKGVTLADIKLLDESFPRAGQDGKPKKK